MRFPDVSKKYVQPPCSSTQNHFLSQFNDVHPSGGLTVHNKFEAIILEFSTDMQELWNKDQAY